MDVKGKVLLQLFNKSKLRNGTKTFLEPKILFSAPLSDLPGHNKQTCSLFFTLSL